MGIRHFNIFVRMTVKTEIIALLDNQSRVFRRMRIMTGSTHAALERDMFHSAACPESCYIVAHLAQAAAALNSSEGLLGRWWIVAHLAITGGDWIMGAGFKEFWL